MPRKSPHAFTPLQSATTAELLAELERRSLGCLTVCVRAEEAGDVWRYIVKGSPILLGALSAALSLEASRVLAQEHGDGHEPAPVANR